MLDILKILQSHLINSGRAYMVGSAMLTEALKTVGKELYPPAKDCDIVLSVRWSRELTEIVFRGLFDVVDIKWTEQHQYANAGVARRTLITLADNRVIDLLVLKEDVGIADFCSIAYSQGVHATAFICWNLDGAFELRYSELFDLQVLQNLCPLQVWGGTEEFYTKAKARFKATVRSQPALRDTVPNKTKKLLA